MSDSPAEKQPALLTEAGNPTTVSEKQNLLKENIFHITRKFITLNTD